MDKPRDYPTFTKKNNDNNDNFDQIDVVAIHIRISLIYIDIFGCTFFLIFYFIFLKPKYLVYF